MSESGGRDIRDSLTDIKGGMKLKLTAIINKEEDMYVALCPELDIASQGNTIEEAKDNLKEAVSLFLECASKEEITARYSEDIYISTIEVSIA